MYKNTSQRYKDTIYNPSIQSVVNIYVDGVLLNPKYLTDFKKGCELFGDNLELGSVPSQYIEMQIHKNSGITNPKTIKIEYGILVNNALTVAEVNSMMVKDLNKLQIKSLAKYDNSFEIIPIGTYNVDDYNSEDDNVINIKALDNIIKLDKDDGYYDASTLIEQKGYATLGEIAQDICNKKGLELVSSSFLNSNNKVSVYDNQLTAREYMSYIAEKAGRFCCANREGKIEFRKIGQDTAKIPLKLFKTYKFGEEYKISRVAYEDGIRSFKFGNETRNTLWIRQENLFVTNEVEIQNIYNEIKDLTIYSFEGSVIIDPATDIGDKIQIGDKTIIYQGEMTLNKRFIADIKSKINIKQKEETTVKKENQKVINRRVQSEIDEANGKITQLIEENAETTNKLSEHTQTIDSMKDTLKSQETKIETVENKADNAQTTANTATTKANNAQTSANTANTNAQNAQKTANANTTKITTNTTKIAEVERTVDGITQSVSAVEEKVETVESTANAAKSTADNINTNLSTNYYTKTETDTTIEQKITDKEAIINSEITKSKQEAIDSANTSTDNKLKNYSTTAQMNNAITQKITDSENSITLAVNNKIENIQVDTDNLLLNTALKTDTSNFTLSSGITRATDKLTPNGNYCFKYNISGLTADAWRSANPDMVALNANEIVTASANVYIPSGVTNSNINIEIEYFNSSNSRIRTSGKTLDLTKTNQWQRIYVSGTAPANTAKVRARVWIQRNGQCWVGDLKLGKGNTLTSWCPSSKDYSTKEETKASIKVATDSINTEVSKKVGKTEVGTYIKQNIEAVKVAWNQISEFIQMMIINNNASFAILDEDKKVIMALDKTGQHFYKTNGTTILGEMGIQKIDNETYISFSVDGEYNSSISDGMAWGLTTKSDGKFWPILYLKDFYMPPKDSDACEGKLILDGCDLILGGIGAGIISGSIKIYGDPRRRCIIFY